MRVGILTSIEPRHQHFVRRVCATFNVTAIVQEDTGYSPARTDGFDLTADEKAIVAAYYAERTRQERLMVERGTTAGDAHSSIPQRVVSKTTLNDPDTVAFLRQREIDVALVYGTDLIRPPLLDAFSGRMVNMHLGLSPYYRGTATNFYPLLNEEPEYVGATIHLIDPGIDTGAILTHARPNIIADDQPHTIGCKSIDAGIDALLRVVPQWYRAERKPVLQWKPAHARLYLRKDFHPQQVVELQRKVDGGLIRRYAARANDVAPKVRLID